MPEQVRVGVDLGGTRIRVAAGGRPGNWSRRFQAPAPALAGLPQLLRRLWRRWRLSRGRVDALVVAAKGIWTPAERRALEARLGGFARRVRAISDAEAAFHGALDDEPGILVLAGTGSIVLGQNRGGRRRRAGGLGALLGDEGSAFWIGRLWLKAAWSGERARKIARDPDAVRRVAGLAPSVLRRAARGHQVARLIVTGSQEMLAALTCQVAQDLGLRPTVRVSWAGSLMANPAFRRGVWRALERQGMRPRVVPPKRSPVVAARDLAVRLAEGARP